MNAHDAVLRRDKNGAVVAGVSLHAALANTDHNRDIRFAGSISYQLDLWPVDRDRLTLVAGVDVGLYQRRVAVNPIRKPRQENLWENQQLHPLGPGFGHPVSRFLGTGDFVHEDGRDVRCRHFGCVCH